jgi:hypothetical protein
MGALIPTPADASIRNRATFRFSPPIIEELRAHQKNTKEKLFDGKHSLARVAHRIHIQPKFTAFADQNSKRSRLRWWYFLRQLLPTETKNAINRILQQTLDDTDGKTISSVTFDVTHTFPVPIFQLLPDNDTAPYIINNSDGTVTYHMVLACPDDSNLPDPPPTLAPEPDPPTPDKGEKPFAPPLTPPPF